MKPGLPTGHKTTAASICRVCNSHCPITVELVDDVPVRVTGNRKSPLYAGFCCSRGQTIPEQLASPQRLLNPLKRRPEGGFERIGAPQLFDEVAERLRAIIDAHGPDSVAAYLGTYSAINPAATPVSIAFWQAIGSPMMFNTGTIDQPGKHIAAALLGGWEAGLQGFVGADVWMLVGSNPLVSIGITMPAQNPGRQLTEALHRGMSLIVIDPRRTETAVRAHVHIQPRPGEDATILAAMLHVVLREKLHDAAFAEAYLTGLTELKRAVERFTPDYAAARADVPAEQIVEAARIFARARRGIGVGSTGANMSGRSSLTEYLLVCLNTICGRYLREGEAVDNPGVLLSRATPRAQPRPPGPAVFPELSLSHRNLAMTVLGMPTAGLADEILSGRIKALFVLGGNPAAAMPDQNQSIRALKALDLFVQHDVRMSASAKLAHYVVPPPVTLELPTTSLSIEGMEPVHLTWGLAAPFGMYAPALVAPPPGSELVEEWELFYEVARRLELELQLQPNNSAVNSSHREPREPVQLDMANKPSLDDLLYLLSAGSRVPLDEVKRHPDGALFPEEIRVAPADPACTARMDVGNAAMLAELAEVAAEAPERDGAFPFRLIGRRMSHVYNSAGRDMPSLVRKGGSYNPAFVHPDDLAALGLGEGDVVEITSAYGAIPGIVHADGTLRRGVIAMSHSFGDLPEELADFRAVGSNTSQLTSVEDGYDRHSGIPRMSAIPVRLARSQLNA